MNLIQVRNCDGKCCEEGPRWPTDDGASCRFLVGGKCWLMAGIMPIPDEPSPAWPDRDPVVVFDETCKNFPQNTYAKLGKTGGCCWQWVEA